MLSLSQLGLSKAYEGPEGFTKFQGTRRNKILVFSSKADFMVPSYDKRQQPNMFTTIKFTSIEV